MDMNYYGQQAYYGAPMYNQPGMYNTGMVTPQNNPSLTAEEMQIIKQVNPSKIDITITEADKLRAICNHKDQNKIDRVVQIQDGSGDVYCPICNNRWSPENLSKEEVKEVCDKLIAAMQNAKWVGDYGVQLTREYFAMIPLLEKFPDLYEYAMKQFNKYCNVNGYQSANDAAIYNQYNNLMGYSAAPSYGSPQGYYGMGMAQQPAGYQAGYMSQPMPGYMGQQVMPGYMNQPAGNPTVAQNATNVNPMQANMYNQQQPYVNPYAPIAPTPGVPTMGAPTYSPAAAQQPQQATQGNTTVTENANGTTTSSTEVQLS